MPDDNNDDSSGSEQRDEVPASIDMKAATAKGAFLWISYSLLTPCRWLLTEKRERRITRVSNHPFPPFTALTFL
jgi:hypothetical protein